MSYPFEVRAKVKNNVLHINAINDNSMYLRVKHYPTSIDSVKVYLYCNTLSILTNDIFPEPDLLKKIRSHCTGKHTVTLDEYDFINIYYLLDKVFDLGSMVRILENITFSSTPYNRHIHDCGDKLSTEYDKDGIKMGVTCIVSKDVYIITIIDKDQNLICATTSLYRLNFDDIDNIRDSMIENLKRINIPYQVKIRVWL